MHTLLANLGRTAGKDPHQPSQHLSLCWHMGQGASPGLNDPGENIVLLRERVKWQNTTRSWSGEPELTEGTWLQLMCCAPSHSHCPKFRSNGVHGVYEVFQSTPEKTENTE